VSGARCCVGVCRPAGGVACPRSCCSASCGGRAWAPDVLMGAVCARKRGCLASPCGVGVCRPAGGVACPHNSCSASCDGRAWAPDVLTGAARGRGSTQARSRVSPSRVGACCEAGGAACPRERLSRVAVRRGRYRGLSIRTSGHLATASASRVIMTRRGRREPAPAPSDTRHLTVLRPAGIGEHPMSDGSAPRTYDINLILIGRTRLRREPGRGTARGPRDLLNLTLMGIVLFPSPIGTHLSSSGRMVS
jgi:hypothetical protein